MFGSVSSSANSSSNNSLTTRRKCYSDDYRVARLSNELFLLKTRYLCTVGQKLQLHLYIHGAGLEDQRWK